MHAIPNSSVTRELPDNWTLFSKRLKSFPTFAPWSVQVTVKLLPSTTVAGPTGLMVTVWASEMPNTPSNKFTTQKAHDGAMTG